MLKILSAVADEKLGYKFGKPHRVGEKSLSVVVPILRTTSLHRQYISFPETEKVIVFDTGKIDVMDAENGTDENVFVRSGTLFRGSTQERALQRSAVLFPHKRMPLSVRCVHRSRGINPNAKTTYGGITPLAFSQQVYSQGYVPKDQSAYWASAETTTQMFCSMTGKAPQSKQKANTLRSVASRQSWHSSSAGMKSYMASPVGDEEALYSCNAIGGLTAGPIGAEGTTGPFSAPPNTDDLASHLDDFSTHFDELLSKVKLQENQAGVAVLTDKGVETIEFFDHKDSWKALHEAAVKSVGSTIVGNDQESVFEYKPEHAVKQINRVLGLDWKTNRIYEHKPSNGEPHVEITGLSADDHVGEVVELNGSVIHLVILRKAA